MVTNFLIRLRTALVYGALLISSFYLGPVYFSGLVIAGLIYILVLEFPKITKNNSLLWLLVPIYPVLPAILLILLNQDLSYRNLLIYLFVFTSIFDTGAYLVGRKFGKHKLSLLSPQKTWEGVYGGILFTGLALSYCFIRLGALNLNNLNGLLSLTIIISFLCVTGDLFESWLKRQAGLKDSSNLLPGHGGLLDRLDTVFFGAYFFYVFRSQLAKLLL
jgi:phosphatidate cytidylyltransferase